MNDVPFGKPARLGHLLQQVVRKKGIAEESARQDLNDAWKKAAGERVSARSFVRKLHAGVLEIGVTNGTILEELTGFLRHELLPEIQQLHPQPEIRALKFVKVNS